MATMRRTRRKKQPTLSLVDGLTQDIVDQLVDDTDSASIAVAIDIQQPSKRNTDTAEKPRSKPGRLAELTVVLQQYGTLLDARDIYAKYASVQYPAEYRGMWRIDGKKTIRLTDCYVEVLRIVKPMATSNSRDYSVTLRFTNPHNATLELSLSKHDIDDDVLGSHFLAFGSLPETTLHKQFLLEAIKELMKSSTVLCQLQADTLGWYRLDDTTLIWLLANGAETATGFTPSDTAPFIAPTFMSPGNGYYGDSVSLPDDMVMHLLLEQLLPYGSILIASLLGLAARIMIPVPNDDTPGMLRFCSEIIGPPRHGKSRLMNAILSLFGSRFEYDKGTLLNEHGGSDSKIGRLGLSSIMRYCLFGDFDHKVVPGHTMFDKIHGIRAATNNIYADDTGGGTVGTQKGGMRARFKPTGALLRTSNYDHADYALRHGEENIEARVCSFVWPKDSLSDTGYQHANDSISHDLENHRIGVYVWGVYYRRWIMHMHNDNITMLVDQLRHQARELAYPHVWGCDLHRNQCVDIVLGLLMWRMFLIEQFPTSFMIAWIDSVMYEVIQDRLNRCIHVHTVAGTYTIENKLTSFVLTTLRYMFKSQQCYATQYGKLLLPSDVPYNLEKLGYKRIAKTGRQDNYEPGQHEIAYVVHDTKNLAFDKTALYDILLRESDRVHMPLPDVKELTKQLVDAGISIPDKDGKHHDYPIRRNNIVRRYIVIPLEIIYPTDVDITDIVDVDEEPDTTLDNKIRYLKPATDDTAVLANF